MITHFTRCLILSGLIFNATWICKPVTYMGTGLLCKTAETPSAKDSELFLLSELHEPSPENVETVCESIVAAERRGKPFYVAVEQRNPFDAELIKRLTAHEKTVHQDLLSELLPRINELKKSGILSTTRTEDIEIRKISNIVDCLCRGKLGLLIQEVIDDSNDTVRKVLKDYIGKPIADLTYQDLINEVFDMMQMAEQTAATLSPDETLYDSLTNKLLTCYDAMLSFLDMITELNIDGTKPIFGKFEVPDMPAIAVCSIGLDNGRKFSVPLHNITSQLMDVYVLKRIMELIKKESEKKILFATGGKHVRDVLSRLRKLKQFSEVQKIGSQNVITYNHADFHRFPVSEELKNLLETPLYEALLAKLLLEKKRLEEEEELRQKSRITIAMFLCELCNSCISSLKANFL